MTCCNSPVIIITPTGGVKIGGAAVISTNLISPTGGVKIGGSSPYSSNNLYEEYDSWYHLKEQGVGNAGEYINSTGQTGGQGGAGTLNPTFIPAQVNGLYYKANQFAGHSYITLPHDSMPFKNNPVTVSFWATQDGKYLNRQYYSRGYTNSTGQGWCLEVGVNGTNNTLTGAVQVNTGTNWRTYTATGTNALTPNCWKHIAMVWQPGSSLTLYINGVQEATVSIGEKNLVSSTGISQIGRVDLAQYIIATMQDLAIAPVARSSSWLLAEWGTVCTNGFYNVATATSPYIG